MTVPTVTVVEAPSVIPARGPCSLQITIQQNSVALNLTGKTVFATIRAEDSPDSALNASLEDFSVTITTAVSGLVTVSLIDAQTTLLAGLTRVDDTRTYILQLRVDSDQYYPNPIRLYMRKVVD